MNNNQINLCDIIYPKFKISKPIRLIELFAGIGAQAKALERLNADFEHYRVVEFDKFAIRSYNAIHGTAFTPSDITKLSGEDLGIDDTDRFTYLLTYSFPCQDLSVMGKQKGMSEGDNTRSGLLWEVKRLLLECESLPQVLVMENVSQVHSKKNIADFEKWINFLCEQGYKNYYADLNSCDYGVPQNRKRCFMVSVLGDYSYNFPPAIPLTETMADRLEPIIDEKYLLSQKGIKYIKNPKRERFIKINPKFACTLAAKGNDNWTGNFVTCHLAGTLSGEKYEKQLDANRRVYLTDGLAPTLTTQQGGNTFQKIEQEEHIRKLTPIECFRLMDFDDGDYEKVKAVGMSDRQMYKQCGNSIVIAVLENIFKQML